MDNLYRQRLNSRLTEETSAFLTSIREDERIFEEDIDGTEAHDIMLHEQSIISKEDLKCILSALEKLRLEWTNGTVKPKNVVEDVHEFIEAYVIDTVGIATGGKLHTGRSRNDQVVLDIRMRVRSDLNDVSKLVLSLVDTLLQMAKEHVNSPMLLYTHTQQAQIGVFSHYLLAYVDSLFRDFQRLQDCYHRVNLNPLGAGPIGGSGFDLNRARTTALLGFDGLVENSIDAVSSRDFALETVSTLAILMSTLSRIAEDFILWCTSEFNYVEIADEYASVSSIMPQKKNPCTLELIRGRTGRIYGALMSLFTLVKGLPTGYSRDLQETKPPLWDALDLVKASLQVLDGVFSTVNVNRCHMQEVASESYAFALDLAEHLVEDAHLSFREAHKLVGILVKEMLDSGVKPEDLTSEMVGSLAERVLGQNISVSPGVIQTILDVDASLQRRKTLGGPAPKEVQRMIKNRDTLLNVYRSELVSQVTKLETSRRNLRETVNSYLSNSG